MILLEQAFFTRTDTLRIARELLGKVLCTENEQGITAGIITETEAYVGTQDRACHAFGGKRTRRNEPMYATGGIAYVYLCYGIHHLFNVVTHLEGEPHAVLIRALRPTEGINLIKTRRGNLSKEEWLCRGPGALSSALGIRKDWSGIVLQSGPVRIYDTGDHLSTESIRSGPRIGVAYAGSDALLPYRFWITGEPSVSKPGR